MARIPAGNRPKIRDFGTCLNFIGATTYLNAPTTVGTNMNSGYTLSVWVKRKSFNSRQIFFRSSNFNDKVWFNFEANNTIRVYHSDLSPAATTSTAKVQDYRWHHICATYNGSLINIYLDNVLVASQSVTGTLALTGQALFIGSTDGSNGGAIGNHFIDEPIIYSRAWTPTEIQTYYYRGLLPTTNKVLIYLLDEGSGSSATDTSGNGYTGTITGAVYSSDVVCKPRTIPNHVVGSALSFNGTTKCSMGSVLSGSSAVTACMWIQITATPGGNFEVPFGYGNSHWFFIFNASSTQLSFHIINASGEQGSGVPAFTPSLNTWYFISGTYDPSGGSNNLTFRIYNSSGTLLGSAATTKTGAMSAASGTLEVGHDPRRNYYTRINADDCRIYSRALSTAEQDSLAILTEPSTTGLVGRWTFDEGTGTVAQDVSGGGNNGTISGATYITGISYRYPVRNVAV